MCIRDRASILVAFFTTRHITKPLQQLTDISKRMVDLDFNAKYESDQSNSYEVEELGNHINRLSENLERTISELKTANVELQDDIEKKIQIDEMRKEFLSNVSHELKTPLALIPVSYTHLDVYKRQAGVSTGTFYRKYI